MNEPPPTLRTVLWRGCRKRCPQCGQGEIYVRWVTLRERCDHCGLKYLQDQGDLWIYLVAVDRALFILPLIAMIYFRLYVPTSAWFYVFCIAVLAAFIFTLPHRNGMGLGVDFLLRRKWGDLVDPENKTNPPGEPPVA